RVFPELIADDGSGIPAEPIGESRQPVVEVTEEQAANGDRSAVARHIASDHGFGIAARLDLVALYRKGAHASCHLHGKGYRLLPQRLDSHRGWGRLAGLVEGGSVAQRFSPAFMDVYDHQVDGGVSL